MIEIVAVARIAVAGGITGFVRNRGFVSVERIGAGDYSLRLGKAYDNQRIICAGNIAFGDPPGYMVCAPNEPGEIRVETYGDAGVKADLQFNLIVCEFAGGNEFPP